MKIPIHMDALSASGGPMKEEAVSDALILAARKGNFMARQKLVGHFMPLITRMAKKRSDEPAKINQLIEGGQRGVLRAARKYKPQAKPGGFATFAVEYIESCMDASNTAPGGLLGLFRRKG